MKLKYMQRSKENTWRMVAGKPLVRPMKEVVASLHHYMETYDQQFGYEDYYDDTYIEDVLYGLGKSLDEKFENANGFLDFKKWLIKHIEASTPGVRDEQTD